MKSDVGPKILFKKIAVRDIVLSSHQRALTPLRFAVPDNALKVMCFLKPPLVVALEHGYHCVANAAPVAFLMECSRLKETAELTCGVLIHQGQGKDAAASSDLDKAYWHTLEASAALLFRPKISTRGQLQLRKLLSISKSSITLGAQNLMKVKK